MCLLVTAAPIGREPVMRCGAREDITSELHSSTSLHSISSAFNTHPPEEAVRLGLYSSRLTSNVMHPCTAAAVPHQLPPITYAVRLCFLMLPHTTQPTVRPSRYLHGE
ncbi:hypothetical protein E2C01_013211 [Portunus trituberculatus]|uniref:Uncharacterized protein n=1 Tax=Portunus trituberculatus TaxID=210409 RepID=A0A5B7DGQ7_PORTR|nr:hypothetical protein [Portunus trituberculatus]